MAHIEEKLECKACGFKGTDSTFNELHFCSNANNSSLIFIRMYRPNIKGSIQVSLYACPKCGTVVVGI